MLLFRNLFRKKIAQDIQKDFFFFCFLLFPLYFYALKTQNLELEENGSANKIT